jgi:DNA-binding response OmpR family regulator
MLIVEDEPAISYVLRSNFKHEGYRVLTASNAETGLKLAKQHGPDIIILDIMLPKMDGLEMLRILRQESRVPVLFLSAKKDEIDRILGFKLGADDYIAKPFSIRELILRVKAILKVAVFQAPNEKGKKVSIGDVVIDFERHDVCVCGKPIKLAPREFQILKLLIEARGKVLSRERLLTSIWGEEQSFNIDVRGVDQHIARLRRKLLSERSLIATVSNFGYKARIP